MSDSKNILYLFAFMLLMLTGCEAESSLAPLPNAGEEPVELRFHARVVGADVSVARSEYTPEDMLQAGDRIGIWNEFYHNLQMTCKETHATDNRIALEMTDGSRLLYPYATSMMTVCAYAPYVEQPVDGTVPVTTEWEPQQEGIKDPIWGSVQVEKAEDVRLVNAELGFAHRMARLQIVFTGDAPNVSNVSVTLTFDAPQHGVMNLADGNMTSATQEEKTYTLEVQDVSTTFDRTVLTGTTLKTVQVTLTDDTGTYTYSSTQEKKFDTPGRIHRLNISLEGIKEKGEKE